MIKKIFIVFIIISFLFNTLSSTAMACHYKADMFPASMREAIIADLDFTRYQTELDELRTIVRTYKSGERLMTDKELAEINQRIAVCLDGLFKEIALPENGSALKYMRQFGALLPSPYGPAIEVLCTAAGAGGSVEEKIETLDEYMCVIFVVLEYLCLYLAIVFYYVIGWPWLAYFSLVMVFVYAFFGLVCDINS